MKVAEVNGSFLRWDSNNDHAWYTPLYAVVGESDWHPLFPLHVRKKQFMINRIIN